MIDEKAPSYEHVENVSSNLVSSSESTQDPSSLVDVTANKHDSSVPQGYWTSFRFPRSCIAIVLLANCLFIGYAMPVCFIHTR